MEWTDERMDDCAGRMDAGFERVDGDIRDLRTEIRDLRTEIRDEFKAVRGEMRDELKTVREELRAEMQAGFGLVHTEMAAFRTDIAELRGMILRVVLTTLAGALALATALVAVVLSGAVA